MEQLLQQVFTEGGLIYLLFFMIVWWFIWKGIPYFVNLFSEIRKDFLLALKLQQETFEKTLKTISDDFVKRVEKSESWHEKHQNELNEIKSILIKK